MFYTSQAFYDIIQSVVFCQPCSNAQVGLHFSRHPTSDDKPVKTKSGMMNFAIGGMDEDDFFDDECYFSYPRRGFFSELVSERLKQDPYGDIF